MTQKSMGGEEVVRLHLWEEHEHICGRGGSGASRAGKTGRAHVGREEFRPGSLGSEKHPRRKC